MICTIASTKVIKSLKKTSDLLFISNYFVNFANEIEN